MDIWAHRNDEKTRPPEETRRTLLFRGETLLLAEDDGLNAEVLENLRLHKPEGVHAENGKVAVDLFERSAREYATDPHGYTNTDHGWP
ncbi:MAG: hypothetical protein ACLS58_07730 [Sutterella wadsworthensis]